MKPLPTGYRTATADGHRIVIYCDRGKFGDVVGEVTAPTGATHAELVALEDQAADVAIAHAQKAETQTEAKVEAKRRARTPAPADE